MEYIVSGIIAIVAAILSYQVGKKNARTNEFSALVEAYDKLASDLRTELNAAKVEINSLRQEIKECYRVINELRAELAEYEKQQ